MKTNKTYDEHLAKLNTLRDEMLEIKHTPDAEARKSEAEYASAFKDMLHTGMSHKALKRGSDGAGGYLVPDTFEQTLVRSLTEKSVLRKLATVFTTNKRMKIPCIVSDGNAAWIPEGEVVPLSEIAFGEIILDAYKLAHKIIVSDEMLEDADFDVEDYIRQLFVESISVAEESAFFTGDGNGKPLGIIHQAEVGCVSDEVGQIDFDDIINLIHSVKPPYRNNAALVMSTDAMAKLRRIAIYRGKSYWGVSIADGEMETLFGYPVYVTNDLPAVEAGNLPVLFGDFSHFWIGERGKRSIKRLVERYADKGQVAYITSERIDAKLVLPEAVKILKIKA